MKYLVLRVLNLAGLLGAVAWLASEPDWEPAITAAGLVGTLIGLEVRGRKTREVVSAVPSEQNSYSSAVNDMASVQHLASGLSPD